MLEGNRKFFLGMIYLVMPFLLVGGALWKVEPTQLATVITSILVGWLALAPAIGAIVYGNVKEHLAKSGNGSTNGGQEK
jgi:uncharacterized membrane protein